MISRLPMFAAALLALAAPAGAQSEPYRVFDTRPVIIEGPYMVATGETTATIVWLYRELVSNPGGFQRASGLGVKWNDATNHSDNACPADRRSRGS